jgi:hypothetical protein
VRTIGCVFFVLVWVGGCASKASPEATDRAITPPLVKEEKAEPVQDVSSPLPKDAGAPDALPKGVIAVDMDGDGVDEHVSVTETVVRIGDEELPHGLESANMRPVTVKVIDINASDARKEVLLRVREYEALGHHVVVYSRGGKVQVSRDLYLRDVRTSGDGFLRATSWVQDKRREHVYSITDKGLVPAKKRKAR